MRVRNTKACHVSLSRFGKTPTGETLMVEIESVSIEPGETQDVEDSFLASEGAKDLVADGSLVVEPGSESETEPAKKRRGGAE